VFALAAITISFGKILYDASMGAWLADRVAYARRGRVLGLAESAWAGAMLIGVPVLAVVVASAGWRWAYAFAGIANLAALAWIRRGLQPEPVPTRSATASATGTATVRGHLTGFVGSLPVFAAVGLLMAASSLVFVVFGAWLEDAHGFSAAGVGAVSFLLGAVELVASTSTVRFTDRVGKPLAVVVGAAVMVPAGIGLAVVGGSVAAGIALLALFVLGFEFALVSSVPLVSELHPEARASSLGLALGFGTVGRGIAAIVATRLYTTHGIGAPSATAAVCAGVVALVMATVREPEPVVQPGGCS
jgi:predicted MFS family arabinose efflux permease